MAFTAPRTNQTPWARNQAPIPPATNTVGGGNPIANQYKLYNSAVGQQAEDYGDIMGGYRNLIAQNNGNRGNSYQSPQPFIPKQISSNTQLANPQQYNPTSISAPQMASTQSYNPANLSTPEKHEYSQSGDVTKSIANLAELSKTGGYSDEGIRDLRARGISPIRSVYANAQRDMNRGRALQGGYSPNFNASQAKMAREMSEQMASQVSNVNAGIAENVAKNRLSIAPTYASATSQQSDLANQIGLSNAKMGNEANMFNTGAKNEANKFNAGAVNQASIFNTGNINENNRLNANNINEANKFNIGNVNDVNKFNIMNAQDMDKYNTGNVNQAQMFNITNKQDMDKMNEAMRSGDQNRIMQALQGMQSMYGTTPAMSKLFGDQAMNQSEAASRNKRQAEEMMLRGARV